MSEPIITDDIIDAIEVIDHVIGCFELDLEINRDDLSRNGIISRVHSVSTLTRSRNILIAVANDFTHYES